MTEKTYLLLSQANVSSKKILEYIGICEGSDHAFECLQKGSNFELFSAKEIEQIENIINQNRLKEFEFGLNKLGIKYITYENEKFPERLKQIYDPPAILYYRGNINILSEDSIAIVGSRVCTRYGMEQTKIFSNKLTKAGFVIVSGLAEGIDSIAQRECVENGGKTIAVLAGKLNNIYPFINEGLANEIVEKGGVLISELNPSANIKGYHFIQRNRIIAGLALGVFVPEASEKSGSLATVNFAIENGRQIFALPGQVTSSKSAGTNRLIRSLQACCVLEPNHIIEQFPQFKKQKLDKQKAVQLDLSEQMVLSLLENEEMHYDQILEKSQMDSKSLNSLLTRMEIRGLIVRLAGNSFARKV